MSATLAPIAWPQPTRPSSVYAREVVLSAVPGAPRALQWLLQRSSPFTPRQLGDAYLALSAVSMAGAGFFYWQGATFVLPCAGLELLLVGAAMLFFARHARDRELLTLVGRSLQVEQCYGSRVRRADFVADTLTVEPAAGQGSLIELHGCGQTARVGRLLRPELRAAFARELRQALRRASARAAPPARSY
jgi:uncharacterized membrane protein